MVSEESDKEGKDDQQEEQYGFEYDEVDEIEGEQVGQEEDGGGFGCDVEVLRHINIWHLDAEY